MASRAAWAPIDACWAGGATPHAKAGLAYVAAYVLLIYPRGPGGTILHPQHFGCEFYFSGKFTLYGETLKVGQQEIIQLHRHEGGGRAGLATWRRPACSTEATRLPCGAVPLLVPPARLETEDAAAPACST